MKSVVPSSSIIQRNLPLISMLFSGVCASFTQYQPVGACVFMFHGSYLFFLHITTGRFRFQWLGTLVVAFGLMLSMSQIFRKDEKVSCDWFSVAIVSALETLVMHGFLLVARCHLRLIRQVRSRFALLCYPVIATTMYAAVSRYAPIGSHGSLGYGLHEWRPFIQVVSLVGLTGLNFVIITISTLIAHCFIIRYPDSHTFIDDTPDEEDKEVLEKESTGNSSFAGTAPPWYHGVAPVVEVVSWHFPAKCASILFISVWVFGSLRILSPFLYQRGVDSTSIPPEGWVDTACIVWPDGEDPIRMTQEALETHDTLGLVLWSESAAGVFLDDRWEEITNSNLPKVSRLGAQVSSLAVQYNVTIGATYLLYAEPGVNEHLYNMLSFWDSDGAKIFDYTKRNPVPVMEESVVKGPSDLIGRVQSRNIGNFNTAICFDFDFPEFIRKSTTSGLLIQTANTWGVVGYFHGINSSFRAIENGTYLARCASRGPSGLWDAYGDSVSYQTRAGRDILYFQVPKDPQRIWTVYSNFGFVLDYVLFGSSCLFVIILIQ